MEMFVNLRKLIIEYGQGSGLIMRIAEIVRDKNWKSAWLVLTPQPNAMYTVRWVFWKKCASKKNDSSKNENFWIKCDLYHLKNEDKDILLSPTGWMNDNLMDAAQHLICKALGIQNFQSVLYCQMRNGYRPVTGEHIQLLHNGTNHWFLRFCSRSCVQICDSMGSTLSRSSRKCIQTLYKQFGDESPNGIVPVTFLPVFNQSDSCNCGLFAIAYAADMLNGKSPIDAKFNVPQMRIHLKKCLELETLYPLPKESSD